MNKIVFFNHYHRGDLHTSKEFVRQVIDNLPNVEFEYWSNNPNVLVSDLNLEITNSPDSLDKKDALVKQGDTMFVNTWVGCQWDIFCKHGGINMNTFYEQWELLFKGINKFFDSNLKLRSEKESYLPRMDWNKLKIRNKNSIENFMATIDEKKVLICNNVPASNQSYMYNEDSLIVKIAKDNPDVRFFTTDHVAQKDDVPSNLTDLTVVYSDLEDCDLREISYMSTFCDVIIGKNSGPFVFSEIHQNYMDSNKKFVSFNTKNPEFDEIKETMSNGLDIKCSYTTVPIYTIDKPTEKDVKAIDKAIRDAIQ